MNEDGSATDYSTGETAPNYTTDTPTPDGGTPYIMPRQTGSGLTQGAQIINGKVTITDPQSPDGISINLGQLADGTFGINMTNGAGNVLFELVGSTWYWYDPTNNGANVMQVGLLPDGTYGWAVATPGNSVSESIT